MSDVSVIGLGSMGSALARALVGADREVTVWNRTSSKADPLEKEGAAVATSVVDAVRASPVVIVCIDDYAATRALLGTDDALRSLAGRVLVQLSTGSPREARESEEWARESGFEYLDGALMCYPENIATPDAAILTAGAESAFQKSEPLLKALADDVTYFGTKVGAASALDCAMLSFWFGALVGAVHGARICETEDLPVADYGAMLAGLLPVIDAELRSLGENIQANKFEDPSAALRTYAAAGVRLVQHAGDAQINAEFPTMISGIFQKGMAAGYGEEEFAALIKALR